MKLVSKSWRALLKAGAVTGKVGVLAAVVVWGWEAFLEAPVQSWWAGEPVTYERPTPEPTEFELWMAASTTKAMLDLEFKRHQRDSLNEEITELESKP